MLLLHHCAQISGDTALSCKICGGCLGRQFFLFGLFHSLMMLDAVCLKLGRFFGQICCVKKDAFYTKGCAIEILEHVVAPFSEFPKKRVKNIRFDGAWDLYVFLFANCRV
jgi:hypothetical protein